jgi:hypothetical protein
MLNFGEVDVGEQSRKRDVEAREAEQQGGADLVEILASLKFSREYQFLGHEHDTIRLTDVSPLLSEYKQMVGVVESLLSFEKAKARKKAEIKVEERRRALEDEWKRQNDDLEAP